MSFAELQNPAHPKHTLPFLPRRIMSIGPGLRLRRAASLHLHEDEEQMERGCLKN